jgi:chemotaxis receptor (MCP) glutamine deamidase CheD
VLQTTEKPMDIIVGPGQIVTTFEHNLKMDLETCVGVVMYDGTGVRGVAHAMNPFIYDNLRDPNDRGAYSPDWAISLLHWQMREGGAFMDKIRAMVFGAQPTPMGTENAEEALHVLSELRVPIDYNFMLKPVRTLLSSTRENMSVEMRDMTSGHPLASFNLDYLNLDAHHLNHNPATYTRTSRTSRT